MYLISNKKDKPSLALTLCDKQLPIADTVEDLGVIMGSQLKFDVHVNNIVLRAHNIANLIHKFCFKGSAHSYESISCLR